MDFMLGYDEAWLIFDRVATVLGFVLGLAAIVGAIKWRWLRDRLGRPSFDHIGGDAELTELQALVMTVSGQVESAITTMRLARPKAVAPLCHDAVARKEIEAYCKAEGIACHLVEGADRADVVNVQDWRRLTAEALRLLVAAGVEPQHIGVDLTGGTKPMGIGAFIAAEEAKVRTIYVFSERSGAAPPRPLTMSKPLG